jgi:hypothetical protein
VARKADRADGPGKPGPAPDDPETLENIANAATGERYALAMLYGHAAAWIRAGKAPPPELGRWLAEVLQDLHAVAWCAREKDPAENELAKQLRVATRFKRGRGRPVSRKSAMDEEQLADDVYHFLTWGWASSLEDAFAKVSEYHARMRLPPAEPDQVRDAWNRHRAKFGELHRVKRS